jgi:hypothetical protein
VRVCHLRHGLDAKRAAGTFSFAMATRPNEDDLDLPPLDGAGEETEETHEEIEVADDGGDALDDATADHVHVDEIPEAQETGWLAGSEESAVDVGPFDLSLGGDATLVENDDGDTRVADDDLAADENEVHGDSGEEGPLADDEELREEDLPALDADEDGDMDDAELFDRAALGLEEELRWEDRAWARVEMPMDAQDDVDDSGTLATPADDEKASARDVTWKKLDESGRVTAAAIVPGGGVVVAIDGPEHPVLVRINADGVARIIAEIDVQGEDDGEACRVTALRWDAVRVAIVAHGTFGVQAYRPA